MTQERGNVPVQNLTNAHYVVSESPTPTSAFCWHPLTMKPYGVSFPHSPAADGEWEAMVSNMYIRGFRRPIARFYFSDRAYRTGDPPLAASFYIYVTGVPYVHLTSPKLLIDRLVAMAFIPPCIWCRNPTARPSKCFRRFTCGECVTEGMECCRQCRADTLVTQTEGR